MSSIIHARVGFPLVVCLASLVAGAAFAFSGGPPDARTGAPGESTCVACHSTFPLNSGAGELSLSGLPDAYAPGGAYDLILRLEDPDATRWGFELTILDANGDAMGELEVNDAGTQLSSSGGRDYLKHNTGGTDPGTTGATEWTFRWTAPDAGAGAMTAYVAGNGANNNGSSSGDRIYATSFGADEDTGVSAPETPAAFALHGAVPNPFNPTTRIRFDLARAAHVRVTVLTVGGRRVATLADGMLGAGPQAIAWNGRDRDGRAVASGTYVFSVEVDGGRGYGLMTLLK